MYLEKLEMQGFKSFANKNKLIFFGQAGEDGKRGLTAIVGPNGSGKSNIADAVRWVLGEQSLKTLRGKRSEDIIFSGSDKKSRLGMAEVSIYINNSDTAKREILKKTLAHEDSETEEDFSPLNYDEIIITRRVFRDGNSEYLLNNKKVRLVDIQILLARMNIGQKSYSVIGQGMLDSFLSSSLSERKEFFDEATGVKQYQIKRDSAFNRLENSQENLNKADMLLNEIRPRLRALNRQLERLRMRGEIEASLLEKQNLYYSTILQEITDNLFTANQEIADLKKTSLTKQDEVDLLNKKLETLITEDSDDSLEKENLLLQSLSREREQILKELNSLNRELELRLESEGKFDLAWLNKKQEELKSQRSLILEKKQINLSKEDSLFKKQDHWQRLINDIDQKLEKQNSLKTLNNELLFEYRRGQEAIHKLEATIQAFKEYRNNSNLDWLNAKQKDLKSEIKKLEDLLGDSEKEDLEEKMNSLEKEGYELGVLIKEAKQKLDAINKDLGASSGPELDQLQLEDWNKEFLKQLDKLKNEKDLEKIKVLIDKLKLDFKKQIELLINKEDMGKLRQAKDLQASIIKTQESQEIVNIKINEYRNKIKHSQELLLTHQENDLRLRNELVGIEEKINRYKNEFNLEKAKSELELLFVKQNELELKIKDTGSELRLEKTLEQKDLYLKNLNQSKLDLSIFLEKKDLDDKNLEQIDLELVGIEKKIGLGGLKFNKESIELNLGQLKEKLTDIEEKINNVQISIKKSELSKEEEKKELFYTQTKLQETQEEFNLIERKINNFRIEKTRQETRLEDLEKNISDENLKLDSIKNYKSNESLNIDLGSLREEINNLKGKLHLIGGIDPEVEKEHAEINERFLFLDKQTEDLKDAIKSLEKIINELDLLIKDKFEREFKIISEKFNDYFKILFNGGNAKIFKVQESKEEEKDVEVEMGKNDNLKRLSKSLNLAGIEIQATPPGKKIQSISMLSGGERALTAIALICAIISANPSPFVVLDEVDAALDEANSERLAKILADLSSKTQFINITHNRALMKEASVIYGITMREDSTSQLLSIRLDEATEYK